MTFYVTKHLISCIFSVPKTGSTSFVGFAYDLCSKNNFKVLHVNITKNMHTMSISDQLRFAWNLTEWSFNKPTFYHGHVAYLDFNKFGVSSIPMLINIIRQPLDRMISYYYFLRYLLHFTLSIEKGFIVLHALSVNLGMEMIFDRI